MPQLDQQRERIQDDLRGLLAGEVRCDDVFCQLFASDASIYEIKPLGVVRPRSTADVVACVQYAADRQIPLHARGAGTGAAGAALGPGLVVDFSKYLRRVIYTDDNRVRVQPGVVHDRLNVHLRQRGRLFGPDSAVSTTTTLGSMVATDASGSRWLKYGSTRQHVLGLQVVLADGEVLEVGREPLEENGQKGIHPRKRELVRQLAVLLKRHEGLIREKQPAQSPSRCGYRLAGILDDGHLDLARLLAGSEGTLALVTEALLATQPLPQSTGAVLLLFDSLDKATRAVMEILPHQPTACDLMDRRHVSLARELDARLDQLVPSSAEAVLLVEQEGNGAKEVRQRLHHLIDQICERKRLAFGSRQALDSVELDLFWQLAHKAQPALYRLKGGAKPVSFVDDVVVPPEALSEFLVRVQNVLKRHQVTASHFCHAGHGELHIRPFLDLADRESIGKMRRLADDVYEELFACGGSLGGEHACGLSRTSFLPRQFGELYSVFQEVKRIFDPSGILNPGKIVGDDPDLLTRHLRPIISAEPIITGDPKNPDAPGLRNLVELQLNWDPAQVADVTRACNGCGECRTQASDSRMCPVFRAAPAEEASPRAKANLIRGVLTGELDLNSLTSDEFKKVADLCINCHMCLHECPAQVDIPKLMIEGKGAYVAANGLSLSDRVLTHLDVISRVASTVSPLANWSLKNRQMRWLIEKIAGVAQGRKLPRIESRSFIRRAAKRRLTKPSRRSGHKVAYFVDMYVNYHDTQLGRALVSVFEHNGVAVYVPPTQRQAGMAAISVGALDVARRLARHNTAILADAVRQGYHIVTTEPGAAVCLTREYANLLDDDDVRLVAANTSDACEYLWNLHTNGRLQLDLKPVTATLAYHMPCRIKAMRIGSPGENLLRLIPGLTVQRIEEGCSGMAGTFGLRRENYRTSLRIGMNLINRLREPVYQAGTTECSTCKMQMEQGTTKPTIHPLKLFALSYGLMPEIIELLTTPGQELIVT